MIKKSIRQIAYVCLEERFDETLQFWEDSLGAGPFFVADVQPESQVYNGKSTTARLRIGLTFLGHMQVEIIAPLDDSYSPWLEPLKSEGTVPAAGLFHHILVDSDDYDGTRDLLLESGCRMGLRAEFGGRRLSYLDGRELFGCFIELIEWQDWNQVVFEKMQRACRDFDGSDPRRSYFELVAAARAEVEA